MSDYHVGSIIFVTGARCERCGNSDDLTHYIQRQNGDRMMSRCRNAMLCAERLLQQIQEERRG